MPVVVGGVATYSAALHLMRAGVAGVLVGFGGGATHTNHQVLGIRVPMATAVADVAEADRTTSMSRVAATCGSSPTAPWPHR